MSFTCRTAKDQFNNESFIKPTLLAMLLFLTIQGHSQQQLKLDVDGTQRTAWIFFPKQQSKLAPVVFAFHGHGGTALNFHEKTAFEKLWPEAIIVYPQGLKTPGALTDPKGEKTGWQNREGLMGNRDLKFFDALLTMLFKDYQADPQRIYATGHSNGGGFTYLLLAERGGVFAAVAPSATVAGWKSSVIKPKPVMHIMGTKDPLVKPEMQLRTIEGLKKINMVGTDPQKKGDFITIYNSKIGDYPLETYIFDGGHEFAPGVAKDIVTFFKAHAKP